MRFEFEPKDKPRFLYMEYIPFTEDPLGSLWGVLIPSLLSIYFSSNTYFKA